MFESNEQLIQSIEQTERRLRDIQLKEIERQFQPHFLFNTMQTIQYLIPLSPKVAHKQSYNNYHKCYVILYAQHRTQSN